MIDYLAELREYLGRNPYLSREKLHSRFGGNPQKAITPSTTYPVIFVFIDAESARRGDWDSRSQPDGLCHCAGDGPTGDMQLIKGNLAVAEHRQFSRILMLFEPAECGDVHCLGEFEYVDHYQKQMPDINNNPRQGIVFRLRPVKTGPAPDNAARRETKSDAARPPEPDFSRSDPMSPETKGSNKRKYLRWKTDIAVKYKFIPDKPELLWLEKIYTGTTRDVSTGGILLEGQIPHPDLLSDMLVRKIRVGLNFFMPTDEKIIKALAEVAWIKMLDVSTLRCVMGLKFKQISPEDSERLKKLIIHLQIKAKPGAGGSGAGYR